MKRIFAIIAAALLVASCTDRSGARHALQAAGYSNIKTTGYEFFGCDSKDDMWHTGFTATGPTGVEVSGVVCSGLLKGNTIRTY